MKCHFPAFLPEPGTCSARAYTSTATKSDNRSGPRVRGFCDRVVQCVSMFLFCVKLYFMHAELDLQVPLLLCSLLIPAMCFICCYLICTVSNCC